MLGSSSRYFRIGKDIVKHHQFAIVFSRSLARAFVRSFVHTRFCFITARLEQRRLKNGQTRLGASAHWSQRLRTSHFNELLSPRCTTAHPCVLDSTSACLLVLVLSSRRRRRRRLIFLVLLLRVVVLPSHQNDEQ